MSHEVAVVNLTGKRVRIEPIRAAIAQTLDLHKHPRCEVCVLLTTDEHILQLNRDYRKVDAVTDVLTFCADPNPGTVLGDIAISYPMALRSARTRKTPVGVELQWLAIHGALHLLGFDDVEESDYAIMLREMAKVGKVIGLATDDPWHSQPHG
jgi:rRNA maturation RNase YbeY